MFCGNCGKEVTTDSSFCPNCGASLTPNNSDNQAAYSQSFDQQQTSGDQGVNQQQAYSNQGANQQQAYGNQGANQQQAYAQNGYQPYYVVNNANNIPPEYKPISMWGYFGYQILFAIPIVGFICLLIFSFGGTQNKNLKNFARSYFCLLIILAILLFIIFVIAGVGAAGSYYSYY